MTNPSSNAASTLPSVSVSVLVWQMYQSLFPLERGNWDVTKSRPNPSNALLYTVCPLTKAFATRLKAFIKRSQIILMNHPEGTGHTVRDCEKIYTRAQGYYIAALGSQIGITHQDNSPAVDLEAVMRDLQSRRYHHHFIPLPMAHMQTLHGMGFIPNFPSDQLSTLLQCPLGVRARIKPEGIRLSGFVEPKVMERVIARAEEWAKTPLRELIRPMDPRRQFRLVCDRLYHDLLLLEPNEQLIRRVHISLCSSDQSAPMEKQIDQLLFLHEVPKQLQDVLLKFKGSQPRVEPGPSKQVERRDPQPSKPTKPSKTVQENPLLTRLRKAAPHEKAQIVGDILFPLVKASEKDEFTARRLVGKILIRHSDGGQLSESILVEMCTDTRKLSREVSEIKKLYIA